MRHPEPKLLMVGTSVARRTSICVGVLAPSKSPAKSTCNARVKFHSVAIVGLLSPRSIWLTMDRETPDSFATASRLSPCPVRADLRRAGSRVNIASELSVILDKCANEIAPVNANRACFTNPPGCVTASVQSKYQRNHACRCARTQKRRQGHPASKDRIIRRGIILLTHQCGLNKGRQPWPKPR